VVSAVWSLVLCQLPEKLYQNFFIKFILIVIFSGSPLGKVTYNKSPQFWG
jgi:hypothetical protein